MHNIIFTNRQMGEEQCIYWGISENGTKDCKILIHNFMKDPEDTYIERVHRLGPIALKAGQLKT